MSSPACPEAGLTRDRHFVRAGVRIHQSDPVVSYRPSQSGRSAPGVALLQLNWNRSCSLLPRRQMLSTRTVREGRCILRQALVPSTLEAIIHIDGQCCGCWWGSSSTALAGPWGARTVIRHGPARSGDWGCWARSTGPAPAMGGMPPASWDWPALVYFAPTLVIDALGWAWAPLCFAPRSTSLGPAICTAAPSWSCTRC